MTRQENANGDHYGVAVRILGGFVAVGADTCIFLIVDEIARCESVEAIATALDKHDIFLHIM